MNRAPVRPVREVDIRFWVPLLAALVLVTATVLWVTLDYRNRTQQIEADTLIDWQRNMRRIRSLFESGLGESGTQGSRDTGLFMLFNDTPGLNHLAVIDARGTIVQANRLALQNRPAAPALPRFDHLRLGSGTRRIPAAIALEADGHIRGYYPTRLPGDRSNAPTPDDAVLYVDFDTRPLTATLRHQLLRQVITFFAIIFVGTLGGVLFIQRYVSRPISAIARAVVRFQPGQPLDTIPLVGRGPLNRLARRFERGAQALNTSIEEGLLREQRLARILESIGDGVIVTDARGHVERLNPVAEQLTGWCEAEARGRFIIDIFAPINALSHLPMVNPVLQVLETGATIQLANHATLVARDGRQYHIADTAAPVRGPAGELEGVVLVFHDVSEAYALREERRVAAIAFETGAPQLIADGTGAVIRVNQAALDISGYSREELLGLHLNGDVFIGQDSPGLGNFLSGKSTLDTWMGPTWWRTKNNELVQLMVVDTAIRNDAGAIDYYVISALDITQLTQTTAALAESSGNYQRLIESIHDGVAIIADQIIVECNTQFALMLGCDRGEIVGHSVAELSLPRQADGSDSDAKALEVLQEVLAMGDGHIDWSMVRADGRRIDLEASLSRVTWEGKQALLASTRDITERRHDELERQALTADLARKEEIIRLAGKAYGIASWELDWTTGEMHWAEGAAMVLGSPQDALPRTFEETLSLLHSEDRAPFDTAVRTAMESGRPFRFEFRVTLPDQGLRWLRSQGEVDRTHGRSRLHGATADITDYKLALQEIERLAYYDPLTGLANRRLFLDRLQRASAHASRNNAYGAVLFFDLDRFKLLNDSLGHAAGDILLRQIAERCVETVREEDTVARLGGDEFVVLVTSLGNDPATLEDSASIVAEKLRARLSGEYVIAGHGHHLTASIGIAVFPRDGERAEDILHRADIAMYHAKKQGRDTIAFYAADLQSSADTRLAIEQDLRLAVERNELELHYQPKVDACRKIVGAEALLRWNRPGHGLVPPMDFIPIAEESGLIYVIGKWVMREACAQLAVWNRGDRVPPLGIAVNVSPLQFRHPDFVACVSQALVDFSIQPGLLTLEITESSLIENIDSVIARLNELKRMGVIISVDDFGTGYSSLYYLKHLPLDEIKIDKSYVRDILDDTNDAAIVESIIAIARNLQLRTVAEGVETEDQARVLRALGCRLHQGYLYSRPLPAAKFERLFI